MPIDNEVDLPLLPLGRACLDGMDGSTDYQDTTPKMARESTASTSVSSSPSAGIATKQIRCARRLKATVAPNVEVPVSIGIAPTKTLAKPATETAKKVPATGGVVHWDHAPTGHWDRLMDALPVTEVRGIAGRLAKRLEALGIHSIAQLREADPVAIGHKFSIVQMRTVLELNGQPAIPVEDETARRSPATSPFSQPPPHTGPAPTTSSPPTFAWLCPPLNQGPWLRPPGRP